MLKCAVSTSLQALFQGISSLYTRTIQNGLSANNQLELPRHASPLRTNQRNVGDRFIPRRRGVNLEVSHYYHTRRVEESKDSNYLDVFAEVKSATRRWRRKYMDEAFQSLSIFNGLQSKRVLNIGESSAIDFKKLKIQEFNDDCQWNCIPRRQPLMSIKGDDSKRYRDHGAQIFRFATAVKYKNLIDWSSKNVLAAGLADTLCICDVDFKNLSKAIRVDHKANLCCVKWNDKGTQLAMSSVDMITSLYDPGLSKIVWNKECACAKVDRIDGCKIVAMVWAMNDQHVITACDIGLLTIRRAIDGAIISEHYFGGIVDISLSPTGQYLIVSGVDKLVKVFAYGPPMVQLFEIAFFTYVRALAWHPWVSGLLCIGGGPGDGSLSFWNVNSQRQLGYRKVKFVGSVDSLMFNKLSGELIVHWFFLDESGRLRSKIVVFASLDKIVDAVPIQPEHKMLNIVWSSDHTKLAMQHRDTLVVWNFFGNESNQWIGKKRKRVMKSSEDSLRNYSCDTLDTTGPYTSLANAKRGKSLAYYNIR